MSVALLISIRPKWVEKIASGKKTVELRKTRPSIETPFKCYIYCTKGYSKVSTDSANEFAIAKQMVGKCGKVIGEFVCDYIREYEPTKAWTLYGKAIHYLGNALEHSHTALFYDEIEEYGNGATLYAWHISDLKIYDKPKELSEFRKPCIMPDEPYCPCCKHGRMTYFDDEIEYALYHGGYCDTCEWVCNNRVTRPPQSWCYIEGVEE